MNKSGLMCTFCKVEPAVDPWTTCADCAAYLPEWLRPPTLSPAGVDACLAVRDKAASGEFAPRTPGAETVRIPNQQTERRLVGRPIDGVGVVGVDPDEHQSTTSSRAGARRRRR